MSAQFSLKTLHHKVVLIVRFDVPTSANCSLSVKLPQSTPNMKYGSTDDGLRWNETIRNIYPLSTSAASTCR